jgi:Pvc16 N-terminal domain
MSNHLAIATVTATLARIVQAGVKAATGAAPTVTTLRPVAGGAIPEVGVNVFLYHVAPNATVNNADLNLRRPKGELVRRWQVGLDLHYLLTFYGDEERLEPERLMGCTVKTLCDYPFLTATHFRQTISDPSYSYLADSTLTEQIERVKLVPIGVNTDEIARIWNTMPQSNSSLAIAYQASFILIEGDEMGDTPMPIRDRRTYVGIGQPSLERVMHLEKSQRAPITSDSSLSIIGQNLTGVDTCVRIGPATLKMLPGSVKDDQITVSLEKMKPVGLRAGVQSLQVVHRPPADRRLEPSRLHEPDFSIESNAIGIIVCPTIEGEPKVEPLSLDQWSENTTESTTTKTLNDNDPRQGIILVKLDLEVDPAQHVVIILNKVIPVGTPGRLVSSIFRAKERDEPTQMLTFPFSQIQPGEYLVRVQVDGAVSEFTIDTKSESPTFDQFFGPKILIA